MQRPRKFIGEEYKRIINQGIQDGSHQMRVFEQPINDPIRICLHIEYLTQNINNILPGSSKSEHLACLNAVLDLANLLDRTDLPSKLAQDIRRYLLGLKKLHHLPKIDQDKLDALEAELTTCLRHIHQINGKFAQELRDNEFIKSLLRLQKQPGGISTSNSHELSLWLQQNSQIRRQMLQNWLATCSNAQEIAQTLLKIIRHSREPEAVVAQNGFYQKTLDLQQPFQLVQVFLSDSIQVCPKINIGRHGISITFFELSLDPYQITKTQQNVEFKLSCGVF